MSEGQRYLWILCRCGNQSTVAWPLENTTLRTEILPRARCSACGQVGAEDMRVFWNVHGRPMDGARTQEEQAGGSDERASPGPDTSSDAAN